MRLFNIKDLLKMRLPDKYELVLFKLTCLFIFKSGTVKIRGDRYLYRNIPVVEFNELGNSVQITLYDPFRLPVIKRSSLKMKTIEVESLVFEPGDNCRDEVLRIDQHISYINDRHTKGPLSIMP